MSTKQAIHTNKKQISCKGKEALYDHPHIYLEIDEKVGNIECPYCSKKFVLKVEKTSN